MASSESQQSQSAPTEPVATAGDAPATRFMPYHSPHHQPAKGRYITSNDPRGYIPVYEYPLNGQWIMMDMDDGYILWTGIWKALGNHKADIVKMLESQPELATQLRRVRGGYLKIQGTWLAYEVALRLARRVGWPIRHDLVPLFGPTFPTTCLSPDQPGYGTVIPPTGRRKPRRSLQSVGIPPPHSVPYPKLPLDGNNGNAPHQFDANTNGHLRAPPPPSTPFAPPVIPAVPALGGVAAASNSYSIQEPSLSSSQYTTSAPTYSPLRDYPPKVRYSPYALPRRHHSPSATVSGYIVPSPFGYEQQHHRPLMHRASAPNLRSYHHSRGPHLSVSVPRLSLNTQLPAPAKDKRSLLPISGPEATDAASATDEAQRFGAPEDFSGEGTYGASSGDSARSSIPTPPFSEVGGPAYDQSWQMVPTPVDGAARWPETPGEYYEGGAPSHYFTDGASYSDPSCASPRTTWSYDGYGPAHGRHSPSEQHYQYSHPVPAHHRPMHHHYSSISSTKSYDDRRMSMADSIASSFPEPDMPLPQVSYHRFSQPHIHHPLPPPHLEMWMRERSGSFAEASYSMQQMQHEQQMHEQQMHEMHEMHEQQMHEQQMQYEHQQMKIECVEPHAMIPSQDYLASPASASGHRRSASATSLSGDGQVSHYSPPHNLHQEAVASW